MSAPTPNQVTPADQRRHAVVADVLSGLEGVESEPLDVQSARLAQAQLVLAGVLNNDPTVINPSLPGVQP